ncbi:uncharacterized protein LOC110927087 [Helianthus annuus]|uniref:uncharacterized protein LOC110927087 n=1 Tax=Helianthus annuus TaxID=4232 RepID=UPI000B8F0533|nr:uncharacterized protein LOC110927087 [Helianthus annuus]
MVEHDEKTQKFNKFKDNKRKLDRDNNDSNKKPKGGFWRCGKPGHFKKDCRVKITSGNKTNIAGPSGSKDANASQDDMLAWWVDSGAMSHVCKDLKWFEEFNHLKMDLY